MLRHAREMLRMLFEKPLLVHTAKERNHVSGLNANAKHFIILNNWINFQIIAIHVGNYSIQISYYKLSLIVVAAVFLGNFAVNVVIY